MKTTNTQIMDTPQNDQEQFSENVEKEIFELDVEELLVSDEAKGYLLEIGKWGNFISIIGFVFIALMIAGGLFFSFIFNSLMSMTEMNEFSQMPFPMGGFGLLYVGMAIVYAFPVYYLFNFSQKIKVAVNSNDEKSMNTAFKNLKSHYRFLGILLIVIMSLYLLIFLGALSIASMF